MISRSHRPSFLRRTLAVAAALIVLALTILAVSPALHARLHAATPDHAGEQGCVVSLFAQGIEPLLAAAVLIAAPVIHALVAPRPVREIFLVAPRFLRLPERGPPGS
ncbi:hypothetical protein K0B96_13315 [Horticoccus luteus]|uniref:Uncharacterized protein n=1 Tax=Horticoccus luteus TaxID=2862869 RepID=A0A8F9TV01_9BACT|nr:hypothetical protein [Horticoccus luteus]QYM78273.1 hypothetical protein K0B96_13315 [Horticoccus luteus]